MHDAAVDSRIDHGAVASLNVLAATVIIGGVRSALSLSTKSGALFAGKGRGEDRRRTGGLYSRLPSNFTYEL